MINPFTRDRRRSLPLAVGSLVALAWVSIGSHSVLIWLGMTDPVAWIYPCIVDLAILYVSPFAADGSLPDDKQWPIRSYARRTRAMIWWSVGAFNVLHMVLVVQGVQVGVITSLIASSVPFKIVAYSAAVIAALAPVLFYGRAYLLESMVSSWKVWRAAEDARLAEAAAIESANRAETKHELHDEKDEEYQREQDEKDREHRRHLEVLAAQAAAEAQVAAAQAAARPARTRENPERESRGNPAPAARSGDGVDRSNPLVAEALREDNMQKQCRKYLQLAWREGIEVDGAGAERALYGQDRKPTGTGRKMQQILKEQGVEPPSSRQLTAVPAMADG